MQNVRASNTGRSWHAAALAGAAILLVALALRFQGIRWGLPGPHRFTTLYVDEYTPYNVLGHAHLHELDLNPHYFSNPTFFYYQVGAALGLASSLKQVVLSQDRRDYLKNPAAYGRLYVVGRGVNVLYGLAVLVLIGYLAFRLAGQRGAALAAALFYAVVPLAVISCHVVDPGVASSFYIALTFLFFCQNVWTKRVGWLWAAFAAAGLGFSIKYTNGPLVLMLIWGLWRNRVGWRWAAPVIALWGGFFLLGTPYAVLAPREFWRDFHAIWSTHVAHESSSLRAMLAPFAHYGYSVGTVLSVTAGIGLMWAAWKKRPEAIAALLFLVPYFVLMGRSDFYITRYLNETLPLLLPFTAVVLSSLWGLGGLVARGLALVLALACLQRAPYTLAINRSLAREPDPRDQASDWFREHVPEGTRIGLPTEANFMTPGHLFMQYWKGKRYPAEFVSGPSYEFSVWDADHLRWDPQRPSYTVQTNLFYSGLGLKNPATIRESVRSRLAMESGFVPVAEFRRHLAFGPWKYDLPKEAGWDWIIFLPEVTILADPARRLDQGLVAPKITGR